MKINKIDRHIVPRLELTYKADAHWSKRVTVVNTLHAYQIFLQQSTSEKLELVKDIQIMLLTYNNRILGLCSIDTPHPRKTFVDPRLIFAPALITGAGRVIIGSSRDTPNLQPSPRELLDTEDLVKIGLVLEIDILDHIIYNQKSYFSFVDNKLISQDLYR